MQSTALNEAYRLAQAGKLEEAVLLGERSVAGVRTCLPAHGFLASLLWQLGRFEDAERIVTDAQRLGGGVADAYDGLAFISMALGRHEQANALYHRATELAPNDPRFWYNLACSERSLGRLAEAEAACDRGIRLDTTQYPTYLLRSELRVQTPADNHVEELQARLGSPGVEYRAQVFLGYALGKELDDLGRFEEAFRAFAAAARARRSRLAYDVSVDEGKLRRIAQVFAPGPDTVHMGPRTDASAEAAARCIFIVGLPRSGTTLVERILTGLPGVRSNGETDNFSRALLAASRGTGDVFEQAAAADPGAVAAGYVRRAHLAAHADHVIEKLPLNYLYLGAIRQALPEAKILLVSRSPLDSCFAMYRTLFAEGYPFSYELQDLGRYYAAYARLLDHWRAAHGPNLFEVVYEDLVRAPAGVGRSLAQYCGLRWNDAAIEIQNNRAVSLTASAAQVRRPIYGSSSGRWRHYGAHLEPLLRTLREQGVPA